MKANIIGLRVFWCSTIFIAALTASNLASAVVDLRGSWVGPSRTASGLAAKTTLSLGAADGGSAMLRIEDGNHCTLQGGSYSAEDDGTWKLTFLYSTGGEVCARLKSGVFVVRREKSPNQIALTVTYPASDRHTINRFGILAHRL
jgi:hypothetical protein